MNKSAGSSPAQPHGRIAAALLALCLLGATPSMAATRSHHALPKLSATNVKILALIKRFVASPPVDHTVVEKIIGEKLNIEDGNDGIYFNEYVLYDVNVGPGVSIDISYSEVVPGGGGADRDTALPRGNGRKSFVRGCGPSLPAFVRL